MRPNQAELPKAEQYLQVSKPQKGPLQKVRETASLPVLRLREATTGREQVFHAMVELAAQRRGIELQVVDQDVLLEVALPPDATITKELIEKLRVFTHTSVIVDKHNNRSVLNPLASLQAGRRYELHLNPDYEMAGKGVLQNINSLRIVVSEVAQVDTEQIDEVNLYIQLLSEFSSASNTDFYTMLNLVRWEATNRESFKKLVWNVNNEGRSTAEYLSLPENDETQELAWYAEQFKSIFDQVIKVEDLVKELSSILDEFQASRAARHFGEQRDAVIAHVRQETRALIMRIESELQSVFQFLPQSEKIFTERDISLIDPDAFSDEDGDIVQALGENIQQITTFLSWTKNAVFEVLVDQVLDTSSIQENRTLEYKAQTSGVSEHKLPELLTHWLTLEKSMRALAALQHAFPEYTPAQILEAFTTLQAIKTLRQEQKFQSDIVYDIARLQSYFPDMAEANSDIWALITRISRGVLPEKGDLESITEQKVQSLVGELKKLASKNPRLIGIFENISLFIPHLQALEKSGYYSFEKDLRESLEKACTFSLEATIAVANALPDKSKTSAQRVQHSFAFVRSQLESYEAEVMEYLET